MHFTVRDAMSMEKFRNLQLLAGHNGLSKQITKIGILDYEFEKSTASTYIKGEFVITSLLYAKDDESKILDAVKKLDECGASGLAIKNVFFDSVPQPVLDYANKYKFPIFLVDVPIYFEDLIVEFSNSIRLYSDYNRYEEIVDSIVKSSFSEKETEKFAKDICKNMRNNYFFAYLEPQKKLTVAEIIDILVRFKATFPNFFCAIKYSTGLLILFSLENSKNSIPHKIVLNAMQQLEFSIDDFSVGISNLQISFSSYKSSIIQALNSSKLCILKNKNILNYSELGIFSFLIPILDNDIVVEYSNSVIQALKSYDFENNSDMLATATAYVNSGGNIKETAKHMFQHENTIRYRINRLKTFFPYISSEYLFFEELAVIIQIYQLKNTCS